MALIRPAANHEHPFLGSARLAVGLGLKGVLPLAGWAGITDSPRGISSGSGPPLPQSAGFDVKTFYGRVMQIRKRVT
jgi:hypothetical protein